MTVFYSICLALAVIMYMCLYLTDMKRSLSQHLMLLCAVLCNGGLLAISISDSAGQAILANNIVNLGVCFEPVFYFFCMCEVCHVKLPHKIKIPLAFVQLVILALGFTGDVLTIYYRELNFVYRPGGSILERVSGPLFFLTPLSWGVFVIGAFVLGARSRNANMISRHQFGNIWFNTLLAVAIYAVFDIFSFEVDAVAILFLFLSAGMINTVYSSNLYAVYENREIVGDEISKIGFISFDTGLRLMDCNDYAKEVFKELEMCEKGAVIKNPGGYLASIISDIQKYSGYSLQQKKRSEYFRDFSVCIDKATYDGFVRSIFNYRGAIRGYAVIFKDESEHHIIIDMNEKYNEMLEKRVEEKTERIRLMQDRTILGMAQMIETRDLSTGGHIRRTSDVVRIFADKLINEDAGFTKHFLDLVIKSAPMHDLGKIGVEDAVLQKQARFTPDEYEKMKKHAENGGRVLREVLKDVEDDDFVEVAVNIANYHHERVDGSGYPKGLVGEEIPVEARIMALADVFDALVSKRCYKEAFSFDEAFKIISDEAGTHFDKDLAQIFIKCRPELEEYYRSSREVYE